MLAAAVIASVCEAIQGMSASDARRWIAPSHKTNRRKARRRHREARSAVAIQESLQQSDEKWPPHGPWIAAAPLRGSSR
jgi:ribosomal protein L22